MKNEGVKTVAQYVFVVAALLYVFDTARRLISYLK